MRDQFLEEKDNFARDVIPLLLCSLYVFPRSVTFTCLYNVWALE